MYGYPPTLPTFTRGPHRRRSVRGSRGALAAAREVGADRLRSRVPSRRGRGDVVHFLAPHGPRGRRLPRGATASARLHPTAPLRGLRTHPRTRSARGDSALARRGNRSIPIPAAAVSGGRNPPRRELPHRRACDPARAARRAAAPAGDPARPCGTRRSRNDLVACRGPGPAGAPPPAPNPRRAFVGRGRGDHVFHHRAGTNGALGGRWGASGGRGGLVRERGRVAADSAGWRR